MPYNNIIRPSALQFFLTSSAVATTFTLFSKFEPVLASSLGNNNVGSSVLLWSEEEQHENVHPQNIPPGVVSVNHQRRRRRRATRGTREQKPEKNEFSTVFDDEAHSSASKSLRNRPPLTQKNDMVSKGKQCDPDVGILSCEQGQYCKKINNATSDSAHHRGGVCVHTSEKLSVDEAILQLPHGRKRNLQSSYCTAGEFPVYIVIEGDVFSLYENYWTISTGTTYYSFPDRFGGGAVDDYFCASPSDDILRVTIEDRAGDGIRPHDEGRGAGFYLSAARSDYFVYYYSGFFYLNYADVGFCPTSYYGSPIDCYSFQTCFKCPETGCCYAIGCLGQDLGNSVADCAAVPSTESPTKAPTSPPTTAQSSPSPIERPSLPKKSAKKKSSAKKKAKKKKASKKTGETATSTPHEAAGTTDGEKKASKKTGETPKSTPHGAAGTTVDEGKGEKGEKSMKKSFFERSRT